MSRFRRAITNAAIRLDDSALADELACQRERANWLATRYGLPAIGSRAVNQHGLEWMVQEHVALPTYDSLQRWREGDVVPAQDLYPVIVPTNLSPKLTEFMLAIDRCTTKTFAFVDTMPGRRRDGHVPGGNHIDTICHPTANIVYLDAARVHETIIAHELGHAWLQYVDECEDLRVMRDSSDPQRLRLLCFVQSFVLDLRVNDLIRQKGFDMAPIEADHHASVVQLAEFLNNGGKTDLPREEVVWAMSIAERLLVKRTANANELAKLDTALPAIRVHAPTVMALAETMAAAVRRHGLESQRGILSSIDECLMAAFEHCGDSIDIERELVEVQSEEPNLDKWPEWIGGASVALKTTVGKVMAKEGIPSNARWSLSDQGHRTLLHFILPNGEETQVWLLDHPFPFRDPLKTVRVHMENQRRHAERLERQLAEVDRINCDNRERQEQMLRQAGVHLPTIPQAQEAPLLLQNATMAKRTGSQINGLGLPSEKQVPELLPTNRIGTTPLAVANMQRLSLPPTSRHYMAGLGRFLTEARLQEQLQGEHPYGYAMNAPTVWTDPRGLKPWYYNCFYKWLYTGDCNASDEVFESALDGGLHGANCYASCVKDAYIEVGQWLIGPGLFFGGGIPKPWLGEPIYPGHSPFTSPASKLAKCLAQKYGNHGLRFFLRRFVNPFIRGGGIPITASLITIGIAAYCANKCSNEPPDQDCGCLPNPPDPAPILPTLPPQWGAEPPYYV